MSFEDIKAEYYTESNLEDFENLCVKVGDIDKEAEQFLRGLLNNPQESHNYYDFRPDGNLPSCFVFRKTPQGINYWWDIKNQLDGF